MTFQNIRNLDNFNDFPEHKTPKLKIRKVEEAKSADLSKENFKDKHTIEKKQNNLSRLKAFLNSSNKSNKSPASRNFERFIAYFLCLPTNSVC